MNEQSYIVPANSNNEHFNADCDFAVITLTAELLALFPKLQKTFAVTSKRLKHFSSFELQDWSVSFISRTVAEACLGEKDFEALDGGGDGDPYPFSLPPDAELKAEATSDYLVVTGRGIWWRAHPKHSDITVESGQIDWVWFTQCIYCGHPKDAHVKGTCLFSPTTYKAYNAKT